MRHEADPANGQAASENVALVITSLAGGGAEKAVLTLARHLGRLGHEARTIVLRDVQTYDVPDDLQVSFLSREVPESEGGATHERLATLVQRLEERAGHPFDLTLVFLSEAYGVAARCRLRNPVYVVGNSIMGVLNQALRRNPIEFLRERARYGRLRGKRVVTKCNGLAREVADARWIRPASIDVIYNPIDVEAIRRLAGEAVEGIPDAPYLVHVGRAARQKRHDVLLDAFRMLSTDHRLVLLAGKPEKLRRLVVRHGLQDRVVLPGFQQNPYPWMRRADLLVMSSDFEGFCQVCAEALAVGTPVVSTDCPHGPSEILTGPLARWLVPPRDPVALAERIEEALRTEIDLEHPESLAHFDPTTVARQYVALAGVPKDSN